MDIHLRLVNRCEGPAAARIVIFRRLPDGGANEEPTAWLVIDDFGPRDERRFTYESGLGDPETDAPAIWIAAMPQTSPGDPLDIDPATAVELSLAGLAHAAIVMTRGDADKPFQFALEQADRA